MTSQPQNAPFAVVRLDERRSVVSADEGLLRLFGVPFEEVRGRALSSLVSRKDRRGLRGLDRAVAAGGDRARLDLVLTMNLGERDFLTRVRGERDREGWWLWIEDVGRDDDLFHQLQLEQARWSLVHARSDEGIAMLDADNRLVELNDRFFELMGFESNHGVRLNEEAIRGQDVFKLLTSERFAALREAAAEARERKKLRFEAVIVHRDLFLDVKLSPIHLPVRGYMGWCLTVRDVTHRELLQQLTGELQRKNEDITAMLGNLRQGICTILPGLVVHPEYSRHLEGMLGTDEIAGRHIADLIFAEARFGADKLQRICATLELCMSSDALTFELNEHLLVREFERVVDGEPRVFEADWVPLMTPSGGIGRVLLTLRDVTELRGLQAETNAQRDELQFVGELIRTRPTDYATTMGAADRLLAEAERLVDELDVEAPTSAERVAVLFRLMHTIKGDARAHGWEAIAEAAHVVEETFERLRRLEAGYDGELVRDGLSRLRDVIDRYRHAWEVTLGRTASSEEELTVSTSWVDELLALFHDDAIETARRRVLSLGYPDIETLCEPLLQALARASGSAKSAPSLVVKKTPLRPRRALATTLRQILNHLMTNAYDHGIEDDALRRAEGKPVPAAVHLEAREHGARVRLRLFDDGRGLDCAALRSAHPGSDDDALLDLIFRSGTSTCDVVTQSSGRGVGLDAARGLARGLGGDLLAVYRDHEVGAPRRAVAFEVELPSSLFVAGVE